MENTARRGSLSTIIIQGKKNHLIGLAVEEKGLKVDMF